MFRPSLRPLLLRNLRYSHSSPQFKLSSTRTGFKFHNKAVGVTLLGSSLLFVSTIYADSNFEERRSAPSFGSLVRAYAVYSMCSIPGLVDASPKILSALSFVPGIKQITEAFVRITFFDQFVGAVTAEEAIPLLHSLRAANRGVLFAYSVEVDDKEATGASSKSISSSAYSPSYVQVSQGQDVHKRFVNEILHCIDVAADFENELAEKNLNVSNSTTGRTWVAVKMTALLPDANALIAFSSHIVESKKALPSSSPDALVPFPGSARIGDMDILLNPSRVNNSSLTTAQIQQVRELHTDLRRICTRAKERGVKVIVDAEYSWYQPAIDALTLALMREFNSLSSSQVQPLVYGTFQAYLRRTPLQLANALYDAKKNNYALGVKLVRGAYHPHELAAHEAAKVYDTNRGGSTSQLRSSLSISPDVEPPVWTEKKDTDQAYNMCVCLLVRAIRDDVANVRRVESGSSEITVTNSTSTQNSSWYSWLQSLVNSNRNLDEAIQVTSSTPMSKLTPAPGIGVVFGTHNWESCALILKELVGSGLAVEDGSGVVKAGEETIERIALGQLYGMSDDLTDWVVNRIVSSTPFVIKYVPYGALSEVMPYLGRRAIENKSVLGEGGAQHERQRAAQEIRKRLFG